MARSIEAIRGPVLSPLPAGGCAYWPDGLIVGDGRGRIAAAGPWAAVAPRLGLADEEVPASLGLVVPPLLDAHIHIPQHPVRGRFAEGIGASPPGGRLLASLEKNVYPAEARCGDPGHAREVVEAFRADTLARGTIGGAAYMTVHAAATRVALELLPETWSVGLVLMNMRCPECLRTDEENLAADVAGLARDFGRRLILTDRFAACVNRPLRRAAVALARQHGLRMQTHLNEQRGEKRLVERELYPDAASYTDVYAQDGLLDQDAILAHCIQMRPEEWAAVAASPASIAHCPVSNTLLGSGVMPLDAVQAAGVPYALATDVGASPTTSLLCEMAQYLKVHASSSLAATPVEALRLVTLAPAGMLGLADRLGTFKAGMEYSFLEVASDGGTPASGHDAILHGLLRMSESELDAWRLPDDPRALAVHRLREEGLGQDDDLALLDADVRATASRLEGRVRRVTWAGKVAWSAANGT